ncbi:TetR/AcrR family transcriptional regulator [Flagellimonas hymeniacidonis]|uniref:TetR/AcrR family transcriptional regulator n=1 Tax=Flagellimonas hymeniacidonis TaxID=2603628 RepID=A0A5C8V701_9FLAO|nr:TetR/AcrR family transcriptional regulator [Flagellimonas hymeniacidonis]TXN37030.1 TetR/AcrR family transcriptional regulator [Flagellimonas hymeniacidonis]
MELKTIKGEQKCDMLLEKGMEILWSKGYNATSVNDIVKAADVPKGSFYFYFDSKEDFAVKAIGAYFDQHFTPAKDILLNKSRTPKERILDFYEFRSLVLKNDLDCKMGCLACNLGSEMAEHSEKIRSVIVANEEQVQNLITETVVEAQKAGDIDDKLNAADIVAFFEDAGKGAMTSMKELKDSYPIDNFMNMLRMFMFT